MLWRRPRPDLPDRQPEEVVYSQHPARRRGPREHSGPARPDLSRRSTAHRDGGHRPALVASGLPSQGRAGSGALRAADLRAQSAPDHNLSQELWRAAENRLRRRFPDRRADELRAPVALALPTRRPLCPAPAPDPLSLSSGAEPGAREELLSQLLVPDVFDLRPDRPLWRPLWGHQQCRAGRVHDRRVGPAVGGATGRLSPDQGSRALCRPGRPGGDLAAGGTRFLPTG